MSALLLAGCGGQRETFTHGQISWAYLWPLTAAPARSVTVAEKVASRDPTVLMLVGERARPDGSFVWLGTARHPRVVVLRFALPRPVRVDAALPYAETPPDAPASGDCKTPYAPGWNRLSTTRAAHVFVGVDVAKRRVAVADTDAKTETLSPIAGRPYPQCNEIPSG
jgi:hypothetical protein